MRKGLKTVLTFTAGVVVGAVAIGGIQRHYIGKFMRHIESAQLHQQTLNLQLLASEKRTGFWRESLLEGLPDVARAANRHREDPAYATILWNVRLAYSLNDRAVPQELEAILSGLPLDSAPQCPMPRRKLGLPPPAKAAPKADATDNAQL